MVIQRTDRVADVLRRDPTLIEVFIAASPAFEGLRNPLLRKTMARLATVEMAAQVAALDPDKLTERLNRARAQGNVASDADRPGGTSASVPVEAPGSAANSVAGTVVAVAPGDDAAPDRPAGPDRILVPAGAPPALAAIAADRIVELDVREALRRGEEPFSRIMAARREIPPDGALRLRAIFEPVPLYAVMAKQGFDHWTEERAADDWVVWFHPRRAERTKSGVIEPAPAMSPSPPPDDARTVGAPESEVIVLDVRGMEPPEPLVLTLSTLETLPPGATLLQINERVPQFLLPRLESAGFTYEVRKQESGLVRTFIRRRDEE